MGAIRKTLSIATLGTVNWRSKSELLERERAALEETSGELVKQKAKSERLGRRARKAEKRARKAELKSISSAKSADRKRRVRRKLRKAERKARKTADTVTDSAKDLV